VKIFTIRKGLLIINLKKSQYIIVISEIEYKKEINVSENKVEEEFDLETRVKNQKKFLRKHKINMQSKGPACPKCGKPTRLKKANISAYKGEYFWACRDFPDCRCMLSVYNGEDLELKS